MPEQNMNFRIETHCYNTRLDGNLTLAPLMHSKLIARSMKFGEPYYEMKKKHSQTPVHYANQPAHRLSSRDPLWWLEMQPCTRLDISILGGAKIWSRPLWSLTMSITIGRLATLLSNSMIFDLPRRQWCLLSHFRTALGQCGTCLKWSAQATSDLCDCVDICLISSTPVLVQGSNDVYITSTAWSSWCRHRVAIYEVAHGTRKQQTTLCKWCIL